MPVSHETELWNVGKLENRGSGHGIPQIDSCDSIKWEHFHFHDTWGIFSERFWEWQTYSWLDPLSCPRPHSPPCFSCPRQDGKKTSLGDLSFFILHNLISGIQVRGLLSPNKKCLSPGRRPSKQAAAGWERRAQQPRAAERVSHGSYLQASKELQRLPIKTLLKHFCCCQRLRAETAQRSQRCYLPQAIQWYCQYYEQDGTR